MYAYEGLADDDDGSDQRWWSLLQRTPTSLVCLRQRCEMSTELFTSGEGHWSESGVDIRSAVTSVLFVGLYKQFSDKERAD